MIRCIGYAQRAKRLAVSYVAKHGLNVETIYSKKIQNKNKLRNK